jgi:DNA-binding NtrC family response regulator
MQSTGRSASGYNPQKTRYRPPSRVASGCAGSAEVACCETQTTGPVVPRLLIVGADEEIRQTVWEVFPSESCQFVFEERVRTLEDYLRRHPYFEAIVVNLRTPAEDCFDFMSVMKAICPRAEVIFISGFADERLWIESIQRGAYDLMSVPLDRKEFRRIVTNALERNRPFALRKSA